MMPALVIFDCDGVLVDSEPIANRVFAAELAAVGHLLDEAACETRFTGLRYSTVIAMLEAEIGRPFPDGFLTGVLARTLDAFNTELRTFPGLVDTLTALALPKCVASSSNPDWIRTALSVTGLIGHFDPHLFSAVAVERGKPHPDLFLHAARHMGADPAACVVVEDSVPGVTAAHAAGMRALGFTAGGHARAPGYADRLRAAGAALVFDDMAALPTLL